LRVAVGIMVYNEEANLGRLLAALTGDAPASCVLERIVVVSSGSVDRSAHIAREWCERDPRISIIEEPLRRGKAAAVNLFLGSVPPEVEICALISADVLPAPGALDRLVEPFCDPQVGMTGAHPMPTNATDRFLGRVVHLQWELHHQVATRRPKLGEAIAFRNVVPRIEPETAVDEAFLEALFAQHQMRTAYAQGALVYNHGPESVVDFVRQRRRIWAGHLWLRRRTGYEVATFRSRAVLRAAAVRLLRQPGLFPLMTAAAALEAFCRILGSVDVLVRGHNPIVWDVSPSTKRLGVDGPDGPARGQPTGARR